MAKKIVFTLLFTSICGLTACSGDNGATTSVPPPLGMGSSTATSATTSSTAIASAPNGEVSPFDGGILTSAEWTRTACSLDTIDGSYSKEKITLDRSRPHAFRGWVLDETKRPAGAFSVVLKGKSDYAVSAATGEIRRDVGEYFKDPSLNTAGFSVSADLSTVAAGDYDLVFVIKKAGKAFFCDTARKVTLK